MEWFDKAFDELDESTDNSKETNDKPDTTQYQKTQEKIKVIREKEINSKENADTWLNATLWDDDLNKETWSDFRHDSRKTVEENSFDELNHDTGSNFRQNINKSRQDNAFDELDSE